MKMRIILLTFTLVSIWANTLAQSIETEYDTLNPVSNYVVKRSGAFTIKDGMKLRHGEWVEYDQKGLPCTSYKFEFGECIRIKKNCLGKDGDSTSINFVKSTRDSTIYIQRGPKDQMLSYVSSPYHNSPAINKFLINGLRNSPITKKEFELDGTLLKTSYRTMDPFIDSLVYHQNQKKDYDIAVFYMLNYDHVDHIKLYRNGNLEKHLIRNEMSKGQEIELDRMYWNK
jgi:hypothetical protein